MSIDQVVLSAEKYLTKRPGSAKIDATICRPRSRRTSVRGVVAMKPDLLLSGGIRSGPFFALLVKE